MIQVNENIFLTEIRPEDKEAFIEYLNEIEIYNSTLSIPHPYTAEDADYWIDHIQKRRQANGRDTQFAIRNKKEKLIGSCGFDRLVIGKNHKAELGYWIAKHLWNKGFMTAVVKKVCEIGFLDFELTRIEAHVFAHNKASVKVLEKAGFKFEGDLEKFFRKDGGLIDGKLYALVK